MLSIIKQHLSTQRSQQRADKAIKVIESGDLPSLLSLLPKLDTDWLNQPMNETPSLLEISITAQQPKLAEQLMNAGANPNQASRNNEPLLLIALQQPSQRLALMSVLLKGGANANALSIIKACFDYCQPDELMLHLNRLEQYGVDLTAMDHEGNSALDYALPTNRKDLMHFLVSSGAPLPSEWPTSVDDELKAYLTRCADDRRIRLMMLGG